MICFNYYIVPPLNVVKQKEVCLKKISNITVEKRSFIYPCGISCRGKISWFQCCVALLCFMVVGVNGQVSYSKVESGTCGSVSGRVGISDTAMCETAASILAGFSKTTATERSMSWGPPGCFEWDNRILYYNTKSSSTASCGSSSPCICVSAPECTRTNGNEPNTAFCICGTKGCSSVSGLYCTQSTSTCGFGPACSRTDGTIANDAPSCLCGTTGCTSNTGLFFTLMIVCVLVPCLMPFCIQLIQHRTLF